MALEIRPIKPEEQEEMNRIVRTNFATPGDMKLKLLSEWTLCAFSDGRMATTYAAWPLKMQLDGRQAPVSGVTMVGTLPAYRRLSHLRKITSEHFKNLHERGEYAIAALFASQAAIYQRYGYAVVSTKNAYSIDPRQIKLLDSSAVSGEFHEAGDKENRTILNMYHRFAKPRTGYLERNKAFEVAKGSPMTVVSNFIPTNILNKVIYTEAGKPAGYMIYTVGQNIGTPGVMGHLVNINDIVWLTASAYRAIWQYFANMDLAEKIIWGRVPTDDPLPHLMLEPRNLNITSGDGLLARIVDVERALPLRPYSDEGTLTFEIIDDFCEWNQGKWEMSVTSKGTEVKTSTKSAQLTMPVSTLAMLFFGQLSASAAARMGRLDVASDKALPLWDRVMRTKYRPFCADIF